MIDPENGLRVLLGLPIGNRAVIQPEAQLENAQLTTVTLSGFS
jgi:hypothetical protein